MKKFFLAALIIGTFSQSSRADIISKNYYYLHTPTDKIIEPYNFNDETKTAVYFDYEDGKRKTVNTSDLSKETSKSINGVKRGSLVLISMDEHKFCETFRVFENGEAYIGCPTSEIKEQLGVNRPKETRYVVNTEILTGEVKAIESHKKKSIVTLLKASGKIRAGSKVRIEALFPNGEALVQKVGVNFLDTSSLRLKFNIERVQITDLK